MVSLLFDHTLHNTSHNIIFSLNDDLKSMSKVYIPVAYNVIAYTGLQLNNSFILKYIQINTLLSGRIVRSSKLPTMNKLNYPSLVMKTISNSP